MKIEIKNWAEVEEDEIENLFLRNQTVLFKGTPIGNELMKKYMFLLARDSAERNLKNAFVALIDGKPVLTGQLSEVHYLTRHWGRRMGALSHLIADKPDNRMAYIASCKLVEKLLSKSIEDGYDFLSASINSSNTLLIKAIEENGFKYAEGIINMIGATNNYRSEFDIPEMKIREAVSDDFFEISEAYRQTQFPSRFFTEEGFDKSKAVELYIKRFKEIYETKSGKIFVLELEGKFAGALIALVDEYMFEKIGIKTNALGMGIIIHPRAVRRGVSMALIDHRQDYYKKIGIEYVSFGANFNNFPMIKGLEKLGLKFGSLDMTFHFSSQ